MEHGGCVWPPDSPPLLSAESFSWTCLQLEGIFPHNPSAWPSRDSLCPHLPRGGGQASLPQLGQRCGASVLQSSQQGWLRSLQLQISTTPCPRSATAPGPQQQPQR